MERRTWIPFVGAVLLVLAATVRRLLPAPIAIPIRITSPYGYRRGADGQQYLHDAVDIAAPVGTPVRASHAGTVERSQSTRGGLQVVVTGDGMATGYAHLSAFEAANGAKVQPGDVIAYTGNTGASTGPHLHLTHYRDGVRVDPAQYFNLA